MARMDGDGIGGGVAVLGGATSVQVGAAIGATIFPLVGPAGVVALRQLVAAVALLAVARPRRRDLTWRTLRPAVLLGGVLVAMSLALYAAIERIGLGPAVTIEFLGPLSLALLGSRRRIDLVAALLAAAGVVLLTGTVPGIDLLGVGFALTAGAAWAAYILLSQRAGRSLPGVQATAVATAVAAMLTAPLLVVVLLGLEPGAIALVLGVGTIAGLLSSALPYSIDVVVLRRMPRQRFAVLQSVHPASAALAGLVILGQALAPWQLAGLALVTAANVLAVGFGARTPARPRTRARRHAAPTTPASRPSPAAAAS